MKIQTSGTNGTCTIKSGYITCPVCTCTKFYTTLQRRYGQFSCVGCYRFFKEFFVRPKRYYCETLGACPLDQRTKCKACWINTCIEVYSVDEARKELLLQHRPLKGAPPGRSPSSRASNGSSGVSSAIENISPHDNVANSNASSHQPMLQISFKEEEEEPLSLVMPAGETADEDEPDDSDQPKDLSNADGAGDNDDDVDSGAAPSPIASLDYSMGGVNDGATSLIKSMSNSISKKTPPRRKTSGRIKNWCCLKCQNCLADDCGKCINCLDR